MKRIAALKAALAAVGKFLKTWGTLLIAILALGASVYVLRLDDVHFQESLELQEKRYEELNKQYEESLGLARTALELTNKHYQELSKQYKELTKPHTQHEEIYDKLVRLDTKIERAKEWIYSWEALGEATRDLKDSLSKTESLSDEAEKAWLNNDYGTANKLIGEAYDFLAEISPPTPGLTYTLNIVDENGVFTKNVTAESEDELVELTIEEGTTGVVDGEPLSEISITEVEDPPVPPGGSEVIGLTYDLGPDGATFDPPITLTFTYDPDEIPPPPFDPEDLVIAMWDEDMDPPQWVNLDCTVDPATNTITANVSHFTAFSLVAYTEPAAFETSHLTVLPREVEPDEKVTIGVKVTNTGDLSGSYEVTLKIDGVAVATQDVTLAGGTSGTVTFTTSKDTAGTYAVNVNGLSGTFTIQTAPAPPVAPPPVVFNWWLIGGLIAAVIIIIIAAILVIGRREV